MSTSIISLHNQYTQLYIIIICTRIISACIQNTTFNPDEYYQSIELIYTLLYNKGYVTWEYQPYVKLRSALYPYIFYYAYRIIQYLSVDHIYHHVYIVLPRVIQCASTIVSDMYYIKLCNKWYNSNHDLTYYITLLYIFNWFNLYISTRTYTNVLECNLFIISLYYWPYNPYNNTYMVNSTRSFNISLILAYITIILRPPIAVIWLILGLHLLYRTNHRLSTILYHVLPVLVIVFSINTYIDYTFYNNTITFPLFNFIVYNSGSSSVSVLYGTHTWYWYITDGLIVMILPYAILTLGGIYYSYNHNYQLYGIIIVCWMIALYSMSPHKEYRFVLNCVPLCCMYTGIDMYTAVQHYHAHYKQSDTYPYNRCNIKVRFICIIVLNILIALYFSCIHQSGTINVMYYLNDYITQHYTEYNNNLSESVAIDMLMPCHSTPSYTYLHRTDNITIQLNQLDCSPLFVNYTLYGNGMNQCTQRMQLDRNPIQFIHQYYGINRIRYDDICNYQHNIPVDMDIDNHTIINKINPYELVTHTLPNFIVIYDTINNQLQLFFQQYNYTQINQLFYSHFNDEKYIYVYHQKKYM